MSTFSRVSLVGLFSLVAACGSSDTGTGTPDISGAASTDRIVGGAAYTGAPAVGSIRYQGGNYCTGTVIAPRKVVTAAHCLDELAATAFDFALGPDSANPTTVIKVTGGAQHPQWDKSNILNDIAYLTLETDAPVTPSLVLNTLDSSWLNVDLLFVGYGVDDGERASGNGIKRSVTMPISEVGATQFAYETAGKNTCSGDSGGPAFFIDPAGNYLLAGTTSYGDTYCLEYGVDTSVSAFKDFLGVTGTAPSTTPPVDDPDDDDDDTTTPPVTGCGSESFVGRCDGNTVVWCENNQVYQVNCAQRNKVCGYSNVQQYNGCMEDVSTVDPCNGETYYGRCTADGKTVIWCENGTVQQLSCVGTNSQGQNYNGSCGLDTTRNLNNCLY